MTSAVLKTVAFTILLIAAGVTIKNTEQPNSLKELKERYMVLRECMKNNPKLPAKYECLLYPVVVVGFKRFPWSSEIGYNTNKGGEIGVCTDSDANSMMHVLIHELAHMTVEEYDHTPQFFKNMNEIKAMAIKCGVYTPMKPTKYCGGEISD